MEMPTKSRASEIRDLCMVEMDKAISIELRLSEDDSQYNLQYIGDKLTKCSSYMETLSDISMALARISLEVTRQSSEKKSLLTSKERTFKCDPKYLLGDRDTKTGWLQGKVEVFRIEYEDWDLTHSFLVEIRGAVNDRIQLFKRLDSDIRLQHKLLETKILSGAMGSNPGIGNQGSNRFSIGSNVGADELDLD